MPPPSSQSSTLDGLPKPFVGALRTLFDIMDDKGAGFVKFSEIERRWQDDGTKGLPKGVIESLRKVTPPNGLLSFERFCAGLKICLLRNQVESRQNRQSSDNQPVRPPSAPILDMDKPLWNSSNTATVRPNNAMPQQRTLSMPQLPGEPKDTLGIPVVKSPPGLYGPPKPPRTAAGLERAMQLAASERASTERGLDKAEIRTALQNWQIGLMMGDQEDKRLAYTRGRSGGDGKPAAVAEPQPTLPHKKNSGRRREPRRHTLQNGIDYNMRMKQIEQEKNVLMQVLQAVEKTRDWYLKQVAAVKEKMKYLGRMGSHMLKRMKQIEQEKDVLMQGLQAVEKARDWYLKQVAAVQEKMKYLGRMGSHMDQWSEAQHERNELQRARVLEVNRHLAALTDSGERGGLPLHMNLAVTHPHSSLPHPLTRLKQQNLVLNEEIGKKSERISVLEREKAALLRELFQSRGQLRRGDVNPEPVGFM